MTMPTVRPASFVRYLDADFTFSWIPLENDDRRLLPNGDLLLKLDDLWTLEDLLSLDGVADLTPGCSFGAFIDDRVLERWAAHTGFRLGNINSFSVLYTMVHALLLPSIDEDVDSPRRTAIAAARADATRRSTLPDYTVQVDSAVLCLLLADMFADVNTAASLPR